MSDFDELISALSAPGYNIDKDKTSSTMTDETYSYQNTNNVPEKRSEENIYLHWLHQHQQQHCTNRLGLSNEFQTISPEEQPQAPVQKSEYKIKLGDLVLWESTDAELTPATPANIDQFYPPTPVSMSTPSPTQLPQAPVQKTEYQIKLKDIVLWQSTDAELTPATPANMDQFYPPTPVSMCTPSPTENAPTQFTQALVQNTEYQILEDIVLWQSTDAELAPATPANIEQFYPPSPVSLCTPSPTENAPTQFTQASVQNTGYQVLEDIVLWQSTHAELTPATPANMDQFYPPTPVSMCTPSPTENAPTQFTQAPVQNTGYQILEDIVLWQSITDAELTPASPANMDQFYPPTSVLMCTPSPTENPPSQFSSQHYAQVSLINPCVNSDVGAFQDLSNTVQPNNMLPMPPQEAMKSRIKLTGYQISMLEEEFSKNKFLISAKRSKLAKFLDLSDRQVKVWFQNRRQKLKRMDRDQYPDDLSLERPTRYDNIPYALCTLPEQNSANNDTCGPKSIF